MFRLKQLFDRVMAAHLLNKALADMTEDEIKELCEAVLDAASQRTLFIKAVGSDLAGKVGLVDDVPL